MNNSFSQVFREEAGEMADSLANSGVDGNGASICCGLSLLLSF